MANEGHLRILTQGVAAWNQWRGDSRNERPDLANADLTDADLTGADLIGANLFRADLTAANLTAADLTGADLADAGLTGANLTGANLTAADLDRAILAAADLANADLTDADLAAADLAAADLTGASLDRANLTDANLTGANLTGANLTGAVFAGTVLGDTNLTDAKGLDTCRHRFSSTIDHRTLTKSGRLPLVFLRGIGLPDPFIEYLPSLLNQLIQFYSCFISYSREDEAFAERLYADLQNKGVRCWYAPEDIKIGDPVRLTVDTAIRLRDKGVDVQSVSKVAVSTLNDFNGLQVIKAIFSIKTNTFWCFLRSRLKTRKLGFAQGY